jgi:hypothetical protein
MQPNFGLVLSQALLREALLREALQREALQMQVQLSVLKFLREI